MRFWAHALAVDAIESRITARTEKPKAKAKAVGNASEASPEAPAGKGLTKAQRSKCDKLMQTVEGLKAQLEAHNIQIAAPDYQNDVPASLGPKIVIAIASLDEQQASLELLASEGWAGKAPDVISTIAAAVKKAGECNGRVAVYVDQIEK